MDYRSSFVMAFALKRLPALLSVPIKSGFEGRDINSNARLYICFISYCRGLKGEMSSAISFYKSNFYIQYFKTVTCSVSLCSTCYLFLFHFPLLSVPLLYVKLVMYLMYFLDSSTFPSLESACSHLSFSTRKSSLSDCVFL